MLARILVAYDDGNVAKKALDKAIDLAKDTSAEIFLISVYNTNNVQSWRLSGHEYPSNAQELFQPSNADFAEDEKKYLESLQAEPAKKVQQAGITVHCAIREGRPNASIVEYAKEICAELLVMGTHNRGASARFFLGSTANALIHEAPCPVMVVKE